MALALSSVAYAERGDLSNIYLQGHTLKGYGAFQLADARGRMLGHGYHRPACVFDVAGFDDGCDALNAAGHIGLFTINTQNASDVADGCNLRATCLWNWARQSGQTYNPLAGGAIRPFTGNIPGGDFGVGPFTPIASTLDAHTHTPPNCTAYSASSHYLRCNLTSLTIQGSINNGNLCLISGPAPSSGQFVFSGALGQRVPPYAVLAATTTQDGCIANYLLGPNDLDGSAPANVITQTLSIATKTLVSGYDFDDVWLYVTGTGYVDAEDSYFRTGSWECRGLGGSASIDFGPMTNSILKFNSNYVGYVPSSGCMSAASLYPQLGVPAAFFTAALSGSTLTVDPGVVGTIGVGEVIALGASATPVHLYISANGSGTGGAGTYTVTCITGFSCGTSYADQNMSAGPFLPSTSPSVSLPTGDGYFVGDYNYADKIADLFVGSGVQSAVTKYNVNDVVSPPSIHYEPLAIEPAVAGGTVGASYVFGQQVQDSNLVVIENTTTTNGNAGGVTGGVVYFSTSGSANSSTGYSMTNPYLEIKNNIIIINSTTNNPTNSRAIVGGFGIILDTQGSYKKPDTGPYPGTVTNTVISGNLIDATGANGCSNLNFSGAVGFTNPMVFSGNVDLIDGSTLSFGNACVGQDMP